MTQEKENENKVIDLTALSQINPLQNLHNEKLYPYKNVEFFNGQN